MQTLTQHHFSIVAIIFVSLTLSSCSNKPRVMKAPTFQGMKSGLAGMKNTVVRATPRLFKRQNPRYPAALPMKGYPSQNKVARTAKARNTNNNLRRSNRSTKNTTRYPAALPLRKTNTAATCPVPNNRVVLAQRNASIFRSSVPQRRAVPQRRKAPQITPVSYAPVMQREQRRQQQVQPRVIQPQAPRLDTRQANQQLFTLAKNGNAGQINTLINQGAQVNSANTSGETSLHSAASTGNTSAAQALLKHGANVNARTVRSWTPLHTAARFGRSNMVALLLSNGAQANIQNADGKTAMQLARQANQQSIVAMLRR